MDHTKHIWRLSLLLILLFAGGILGRHFLVPESFGQTGFFRYDAYVALTEKAARHGAPGACADCHDDKAEAVAAGGHRTVQCEVCHDVLSSHVRDDEKIADMAVNRSFELCAHCHEALAPRPDGQPQVDLAEHLELDPGQAIPENACLDCHDSDAIHSP